MRLPAPFRLERYFALHEFRVRHLLGASDCESIRLEDLLRMADPEMLEWWRTLRLGYTESDGHPRLRAEIARLYERIAPDEVLTVVPAEGVLLVQQAVLAPGDHVVALAPAYQSLGEVARAMGCEVTPWPLRAGEDGWRLDIGALRGQVTPRTRLLITCFPHNPTGWLPSHEEWDAILSFVRERELWLLSDEMYRLLEHSPGDRLPAAADVYERAVSLSGLSKSFGLPGLRLGWLASRSRLLLERCRQLKDYTTLCASAPGEVLGTIALRAKETLTGDCLGRVRRNLELAERFCRARPGLFRWLSPRAGPVAFPEWVGALPLDELRERALERGLLVVTGDFFDMPGHLRLGLGREGFPEALDVFGSILPP